MSLVSDLIGEHNAILLHEVEYALYFVWPLADVVSIVVAPAGFFAKPLRTLLYVLLGPIGTADLVRRAMRARARAAASGAQARPSEIRLASGLVLLGFGAMLVSGIVLATQYRWPDWYFPLARLHRDAGLGFAAVYLAYLAWHIRKNGGWLNLAIHVAFTVALVLVLLFVNVDSKLPKPVLLGAVVTIFASSIYLRRLDRRTEEGKSRGGLILNTYLLIVLASGFYLVPQVNVAIANNFGNYYYHLHGLAALFGLPLVAFLFLHHVRRTPTSFPWPAKIAVAAVGIPFAWYTLTVANRKTHAGELEGYRNQRLFATGTMQGASGTSAPHEWWLAEMNDVRSCRGCHDVLFDQWVGSAHALAGNNPFYVEVMGALVRQNRLAETALCQSCHQPVLSALADRVFATSPQAMSDDWGVSCKSCHLTHQVETPPKNGRFLIREEERVPGLLTSGDEYVPPPHGAIRDDLRLHLKGFSNSVLFGSREFCSSCHRIELPNPAKTVLPNPYDGAPGFGVVEQQCKACHMPEDTENKAGVRFPNHHMFGVNTRWADMVPVNAHVDQLESAREGDRKLVDWLAGTTPQTGGLGIKADRPAFELGLAWSGASAEAPLGITVTNVRGGHPFPLGALDLNEAWLYVAVLPAGGGAPLWESGAIDPAGNVDAGARRFGATLLGADGLPLTHHDILTVTGLADVRLLAPGKPHREDYAAGWASGATFPVTLRAELRYRRARQEFMDHVYGAGTRTMPVTVLVTASCELAAPDRPCEAKPS